LATTRRNSGADADVRGKKKKGCGFFVVGGWGEKLRNIQGVIKTRERKELYQLVGKQHKNKHKIHE